MDEKNMEPRSNVIEVDIQKEMQKSFLDYSMSVIVSRALPDVRDGLKPVHRRILYTMYENGLTPDKAYRKVRRPPSATCWAGTIPTATPPSTTPWCVWPRISPCAIPWWTATETSVPWTATRRPPTVIRKPE